MDKIKLERLREAASKLICIDGLAPQCSWGKSTTAAGVVTALLSQTRSRSLLVVQKPVESRRGSDSRAPNARTTARIFLIANMRRLQTNTHILYSKESLFVSPIKLCV